MGAMFSLEEAELVARQSTLSRFLVLTVGSWSSSEWFRGLKILDLLEILTRIHITVNRRNIRCCRFSVTHGDKDSVIG